MQIWQRFQGYTAVNQYESLSLIRRGFQRRCTVGFEVLRCTGQITSTMANVHVRELEVLNGKCST